MKSITGLAAALALLSLACVGTTGTPTPVAPQPAPRLGAFPQFPATGGGGSGTVTSVAATAGGLLAVAGTSTVAPTVGLASLAASSFICNATGSGAVPTACGVGTALSFSGTTLNVPAATSSVPGSMSAADKARFDKTVTASFTQSVAGLTIDVPITAGDGLYQVDLTATVVGGGTLGAALRVNGAALTTPFGEYIRGVSINAPSSVEPVTDGTIVTQGTLGMTTLLIRGTISVRSGKVCMYDMRLFGTDGSAAVESIATGKHNPAATVTSIGFTVDSNNIATGSVLGATRIAD